MLVDTVSGESHVTDFLVAIFIRQTGKFQDGVTTHENPNLQTIKQTISTAQITNGAANGDPRRSYTSKSMTIDNDIMRMTQEDMVDEIMTLRGQRKALIVQLKNIVRANDDLVSGRLRLLLDKIEKGEP